MCPHSGGLAGVPIYLAVQMEHFADAMRRVSSKTLAFRPPRLSVGCFFQTGWPTHLPPPPLPTNHPLHTDHPPGRRSRQESARDHPWSQVAGQGIGLATTLVGGCRNPAGGQGGDVASGFTPGFFLVHPSGGCTLGMQGDGTPPPGLGLGFGPPLTASWRTGPENGAGRAALRLRRPAQRGAAPHLRRAVRLRGGPGGQRPPQPLLWTPELIGSKKNQPSVKFHLQFHSLTCNECIL